MGLSKDETILLKLLRKTAIKAGDPGGREFTGLIGELAACELFGYKWAPHFGYDALTEDGLKVQIKSRKSWTTPRVNPAGTIGKFGPKNQYNFDIGILIELDHKFEIIEVWERSMDSIRELETKRPPGRSLHFRTFTNDIKSKFKG